MANPLANLYSGTANPALRQQVLSGKPLTQTETLPYGGGIFNPTGGAVITPPTPTVPSAPAVDMYAKYRDPKTGEVMSPEEYAIYLGNKVPKGTGQIPNYAGDAMTNPDQSASELTTRATNLNNARNDIATGTTDPYKVGSQSGIAYSPTELRAIEKAYAGIYDPALNDVFARLKDKQDADAKMAAREDKVFATNEAIRQWKATTGTKKSSSDSDEDDIFTKSQLNDGASNSGLGVTAFRSLDNDIKNFYINPPMVLDSMEKKVPMYKNFEEDLIAIANGELDSEILLKEINDSSIPSAVKHYFIEQIPEVPAKEKEKWYEKAWVGKIPFVK